MASWKMQRFYLLQKVFSHFSCGQYSNGDNVEYNSDYPYKDGYHSLNKPSMKVLNFCFIFRQLPFATGEVLDTHLAIVLFHHNNIQVILIICLRIKLLVPSSMNRTTSIWCTNLSVCTSLSIFIRQHACTRLSQCFKNTRYCRQRSQLLLKIFFDMIYVYDVLQLNHLLSFFPVVIYLSQ